jgi:acyl-CoA reductase-like NAD-dependent aldehyde dehydrogenase
MDSDGSLTLDEVVSMATAMATPKLTEVNAFLTQDPLKLFIGGQWVPARAGGTFETLDPGDGRVLARVAAAEATDVDDAVCAAREAFRNTNWATMPSTARAAILHRLADLIDQHTAILAHIESLDVGKPLAQPTAFDVPNCAQTLRYYADLSVQTSRHHPIDLTGFDAYTARVPYGVCAFVIPWNFPLLLVGWGVAPALAAGNTVVIKPAEDTPLSTLYFAHLAELAGVPPGVINVIPGFGHIAGAALAAHPGIDRMSFTGSPEVGKEIGAACGRNLVPVKLELGGKGAAIVFPDVDVESTVNELSSAITLNTGQVCCTATRWLIQDSIYDRFVEAAKVRLKETRIGYGLEPATQMGPVVSEKQKKRVLGYLQEGERTGAEVVLRGGEAQVTGHDGFYVRPSLLAGDPQNLCARAEIFGPVAYLMRFKDEDEGVDIVNRSRYGLANSVWSSDLLRARRVAESLVAGNSWINAHNVFKHGIPYGGWNLSGLGGGVLGPDTFLDYLRPQSIVRPM